jgi:uncharacterized membrane protein YbhN (UPF0104 family)
MAVKLLGGPPMATVHRLPERSRDEPDTVLGRLVRLLRLELELGLAETRDLVKRILIAVAVAVPAAVALIASIVVLIAGAIAPLFSAPAAHLLVGGGVVLVVSAGALGWAAWRLRHLEWPRETLRSFEETWRWLVTQLRSRLTLPPRAG